MRSARGDRRATGLAIRRATCTLAIIASVGFGGPIRGQVPVAPPVGGPPLADDPQLFELALEALVAAERAARPDLPAGGVLLEYDATPYRDGPPLDSSLVLGSREWFEAAANRMVLIAAEDGATERAAVAARLGLSVITEASFRASSARRAPPSGPLPSWRLRLDLPQLASSEPFRVSVTGHGSCGERWDEYRIVLDRDTPQGGWRVRSVSHVEGRELSITPHRLTCTLPASPKPEWNRPSGSVRSVRSVTPPSSTSAGSAGM